MNDEKGQRAIGVRTIISEFRGMMRNRDLAVLNFAILVSMIGFGLIMPFIPTYAEDFGASDAEIGLMVGLFAIVRMVFSPIGGWSADRFGRKPSMVFAMFLYAVNMAMFGFANSLYELFVYRALQGAASGLMWPVAMTYIGDVVKDEDRGKAMGLYTLTFATGTAVGPLLGGTISIKYGISSAFYVTAVLALISAFLLLFKVRESHIVVPERREKRMSGTFGEDLGREKRSSGPRRDGLRSVADEFRLSRITPYPRTFIGVSLGSFTMFFGMAVLYAMLPIYGRNELNLSDWDIGALFTVIGVIQVLFMFPAGVFGDRIGKKRIILVGSIIAAVFSGLIAFTDTFVILLVIIVFYTIGRSIARPLIPAIISSLTEKENRGKGMGLYTFVQNVAFAVGSTAGGYVSQVCGREFPFLMASGVGLAGIAVFALYVSDSDTMGGGGEGGNMIRQKWE